MDFLALGLRRKHVGEKGHKLGAGMTRGGFAQDLPARNLQGRVKRERAVPEILKSVTLLATRRQRQDRIESVERLNGRLFINAEHGGMSRRLEVKTNDVGRFRFEGRIIARHVVAPPGRLQARLRPDAGHSHMAEAQFGREFARTPMSRAVSGLVMQSPVNDVGLQVFSSRSHCLPRMTPPQTGDAVLHKAVPPELHGIDAARLTATDRRQAFTSRQTQNNVRPRHVVDATLLTAANPFQFTSFRWTQSEGCRHEQILHLDRQMSPLHCTSDEILIAVVGKKLWDMYKAYKGAKRVAELAKHMKKLKDAKSSVEALKNSCPAGKGAQEKWKQAIKKLEDAIKGHEKEIAQKWPGALK